MIKTEELIYQDIEHIVTPPYIQLAHVFVTWQKKVLLVRRNIEPTKGLWSIPGGHVEKDETYLAAAIRELQEETGIAASDLRPMFIYLNHEHNIEVHLFHATSKDGAHSNLEPIVHDMITWKTISEARELPLTPGFGLFFDELKPLL